MVPMLLSGGTMCGASSTSKCPAESLALPCSPGIIPELVGGSSLDKNERKKKIPPVAKSVLLFGFRATVQLPPDAPKMISLLTILNYNS